MKNVSSLLVILFIICFSVTAQQTTFQAGYNFGSFDIPILTNIIQNPSGHYIMTGTDGAIPILGTVTDIDSAANVVWSKKYTSGSLETEIVDVKNVSGGGYIVAGSSTNGLLLMRLTSTGTITWSNVYHVASGTSENASRVLPTSDGGFVVAGYVYSATPPGYARQDSANCYLLKVNSSGTLLWSKVVFCSVAYINDHLLNDVAEASDGYVFTGSMSQSANDNDGTYGIVLKTDFNGNTVYLKRWGASGDDVEGTSIVSLTTNTQVIGGNLASQAFWVTFNSTTGTGTGYKYGNGFLPVYLSFNVVPTNDNNYAMIGMAPLGFDSYILKMSPSTGSVIWGTQYTGGFASLLPEGRQVADSGYIMVTTALGGTGYEYLAVKTNALGQTTTSGCTYSTLNPSKSSYSPGYTSFAPPDSITTSTGSAITVLSIAVTPTSTVNCIQVVCTQPAVPTASASPSTICSGSSSTISGGNGVTYKVYDAATNGNLLGTAPLSVSPTSTTTYYIEAQSGTGCVSASRQALTITVTALPGAVGTISGNTAPCIGAQAYSIGSVTNAISYTWAVSGGGSVTGGQNTTSATVTWTTAGSYTITVTASNTCGSASSTLTVTVGSTPGAATATALPNPACAGQSVALSVTSASSTTWSWAGPNSYTSNLQNPSITATQTGTYTVTASNTCGSVTASVSLVVNNKPTGTTATASVNPVCQGQAITLSGASTGATSWAWSGPNAYSSTQQSPQLSNVQANQSGTYTLIATNTCGNDTATVNLIVNTAPTNVSDTATPNPVCSGSALHLNGAATGATSYSWAGPNGYTSNSLQATLLNFQSVSVGTYTLSAINSCGTATASVNVTLATTPTAVNASSNTTSTCYGTNIQLTGTATGGTSYSWIGPNGFTSTQQNPAINNSTVADSGAYLFTATNTCGSTSSTVVINVDTLIRGFATLVRGGDTACTGSQITFLSSGLNINTWSWTGPNGYSSSSPDTTISNASLLNNGQYILTATNACGSLSDTLNIYIENTNSLNLVASASLPHDSACYGATVNFFATDSFDSYIWTGPNSFFTTQQNPTITNATISQSGIYIVSAHNHCGQRTDSVHIYIDTIPQNLQLSTSGNNNASCQGQSITVTAASPGITNWSWTGPAGFTSTQASFTIANIQPDQQGNYIVTAINTCGHKTDTIAVTVYARPDSLFVNTNADSICPGQSVTLTARSGLTNIIWSNSQTGNFISATQPGLYYYTGNDANGCTVYSDSLNVYNAVPPVLNLFASNPTSVCAGQQPAVLYATSDVSVNITWSPGGSHADSLVVTAPGQYVVTGSKNGCVAMDTANITSATIPTISFTDTLINTCCLNVQVTPVVTGNIASYQWSDTTSGTSDMLTNTGVYTVTITSNQGCIATGHVTFNKVCIAAQATASPDSVEVESSSTLTAVTGFTGHFNYQWSPFDSTANSNTDTLTVTPKQTTVYTVIVSDTASGCSDTSSISVYVNYNQDYAVPNVFAPNGNDQLNNNTFHIINEGDMVTVQEMRIFDRYGDVVFDSNRDKTTCTTPSSGTQPTYCWDGNYEGKKQLMGNYVYSIKIVIKSTGAVKNLKGNLTLLR